VFPPERLTTTSVKTSEQAPPARVPIEVSAVLFAGALKAPSAVTPGEPVPQYQVSLTPDTASLPVLQMRNPRGKVSGPELWLFESSPTTLQVIHWTVSGPAVAPEVEAVVPKRTAPPTRTRRAPRVSAHRRRRCVAGGQALPQEDV